MEPRATPEGRRAALAPRLAAWLPPVLLVLWLLGLGREFVGWAVLVPAALEHPFQLDYGEGIVWQQARMILRGDGYSDINELPFVVFHYPPVYHLLSGGVAELLGTQELAAGRLVSIAATLGVAAIIALLVFQGLRRNEGWLTGVTCAAAAGLILFTFISVTYWSRLMRVDMLAFFFSFLGVWFALQVPERSWRAAPAIAAFTLALFTKQTMIAPPLAMLVVLTIFRPRLAICCGLSGLAVGVALILILNGLTNDGFTRHIIGYNINRIDLHRLRSMLEALSGFAPYIAIVLYSFRGYLNPSTFTGMRERLAHDLHARLRLFALVYFLFSCLLLLLVAKVGSSINYFLDWTLATTLAIGLSLAGSVRAALARASRPPDVSGPENLSAILQRPDYLASCAVFALLLLQLAVLPRIDSGPLSAGPAFVERQRMLMQIIREAEKPVISDEMVLLLQAGKEVIWEPAIFAELAEVGTWDDGPFVEMIRARQFAFFLTEAYEGHPLFDSRYTHRVAAAMREAYPRKMAVGHFVFHLPSR